LGIGYGVIDMKTDAPTSIKGVGIVKKAPKVADGNNSGNIPSTTSIGISAKMPSRTVALRELLS
jgi:hypothetical protein